MSNRAWTQTVVEIQCVTGPVMATAFIHRDRPGLALVDRGGDWTVTHVASGMAIAPHKGHLARANIPSRRDAVAFMRRLAPLADWTEDGPTLVAMKPTLTPLINAARAVVFGAQWDEETNDTNDTWEYA